MKKKNKGFTLIELLAVIVILGLLMAIAIPSVTKYINQSRKKTLASTINNYIGALVNDVNDMQYSFTDTNTIYAVPIECIALEKGGQDPFGDWYPATSDHWAYVLVQPNGDGYTYGFTFKDSAGYGLKGVSQQKLDEKGNQIQTGLGLSKPSNAQPSVRWEGFKNPSRLSVLFAATEGDGKTTCTVQRDVKVEEGETPLHYGKPYGGTYPDNVSTATYVFYADGTVDYYYNCNFKQTYSAESVKYYVGVVQVSGLQFNISTDKNSIERDDLGIEFDLKDDVNWCK